ncbi:hypothetical protein GCM10020358_01690 [Amorphoplanes nipponensis]|uniref:Uncharacterized protein n=1 Tax=Actinoplanes nipponensis TaxID=135950 RepID=A0A919JCJ1_9ACTN|nr:hypothetical protein [Actinoplanes nipponensis]GIE48238.1 hypothetical protein Ani05nite_17720 [Actinoplanes nipponensis]
MSGLSIRGKPIVGGALLTLAASVLVAVVGSGQAESAPASKLTSSVKGSDGLVYSVTNHLVRGFAPGAEVHHRQRKQWLLVWAGDTGANSTPGSTQAAAAHHAAAGTPAATDPDFLAVIDVTRGAPTYGKVVNTVTFSPTTGNEPHHMQYVWHKGNRIYAGGLFSDTTYVLDPRKLPALRLVGVTTPVDTPCGSAPDAYTVLRDGTAYASYMGGPNLPGPCTYTNGEVREGNGYAGSPGEVVRLDARGRVLAEAPATSATPERPEICHNIPALTTATCANPHGVQVREDLNIMVTSDLLEPRNYIDTDPFTVDPLTGRITVRTFDISDRNNPRLKSVSYLPWGPRQEEFLVFKENRLPMENTVTNLPSHRGAFASTMQGAAIFYTPDITDPTPEWREIFDDETAYRSFHPDGPFGGGDTGSWLQVSPDDKYLFHAVTGHQLGELGKIPSGMVYVLDIQKLLASGNDPKCNIDQIEEGRVGGSEPDCPALVDVVPIADETSGGPHWGTLDHFRVGRDGKYHETTDVKRLAVSNYLSARLGMDGDHRLCMIDFVGRDLSVDETFRDELTGQPCVDFKRENWPHGATGGANPHGVLFAVADADIR